MTIYMKGREDFVKDLAELRSSADELERLAGVGSEGVREFYHHVLHIHDCLTRMIDVVLNEERALHGLTYGKLPDFLEERTKDQEEKAREE